MEKLNDDQAKEILMGMIRVWKNIYELLGRECGEFDGARMTIRRFMKFTEFDSDRLYDAPIDNDNNTIFEWLTQK